MLLLLGVLERREEVRVRRLGVGEGGMGALLAELGWVFCALESLCDGLYAMMILQETICSCYAGV